MMDNQMSEFDIRDQRDLPIDQVIELYELNGWSAANKPDALYNGLTNSHSVVSAWKGIQLIGIANAISDGHLVVYYPHLLVRPEYQRQGVGGMMLARLQEKYSGFHMQMLTADQGAVTFYEKAGFVRAGSTQSMWIYAGNEHEISTESHS